MPATIKRQVSYKVRVLDVPGFADSAAAAQCGVTVYKANLALFRSILRIQSELNMPFDRVLYFLPCQGPLEKADSNVQEEIKVIHYFCGNAIFERMILVAANPRRNQRYGFSGEDERETKEAFKKAFELAIGTSFPSADTSEPTIVYVSIEDEGAMIRERIQKARVYNTDGLYCNFVDNICARCCVKFRCISGNEEIQVGVYTKENNALRDCSESKCHPIILPRYSKLEKIIGGVAHISTAGIPYMVSHLVGYGSPWPGLYSSDEICPNCKKPPGAPGCTPVEGDPCTVTWQGVTETILDVYHTNKLDVHVIN